MHTGIYLYSIHYIIRFKWHNIQFFTIFNKDSFGTEPSAVNRFLNRNSYKIILDSNYYYYYFNLFLDGRIYNLFYNNSQTPKNISNYNNGVKFSSVYDALVVESPEYAIYVSDSSNNLAKYDKDLNYLSYNNNGSRYIASAGGFVYSTNLYSFIYKYDLDLNFLGKSPSFSTAGTPSRFTYPSFDSTTQSLYVPDYNGYLMAFDLELNVKANLTINATMHTTSNSPPFSVSFYKTSTTNYIYFGLFNSSILIYDQSNSSLVAFIQKTCNFGALYSLKVDQESGYVMVACTFLSQISLYKIENEGTLIKDTSKFISVPSPYGFEIDSKGRLVVASYTGNCAYVYEPVA